MQQLLVIHVEEKRKDHYQMLSHHVATITLLTSAYIYSFYNVSNVVLCLMDIVDLLLPVRTLKRCQRLSSEYSNRQCWADRKDSEVLEVRNGLQHRLRCIRPYMARHAPHSVPAPLLVDLQGCPGSDGVRLLFRCHYGDDLNKRIPG